MAPKKWKNVKINWSGHESAISELIVLVFIFKQLNWFKQQHCDIVDIRLIKNITWVNFLYFFSFYFPNCRFFPSMPQQRFLLPPFAVAGIWTRVSQRVAPLWGTFERTLYRLSYRDHGSIFYTLFFGVRPSQYFFLYFLLFYYWMQFDEIVPMLEFEPQISGVRRDPSTT